LATTDLNEAEEKELYNLGILMAQMRWLDLYSNADDFVTGVETGEGVVSEVGSKDDFDKVILYRTEGTFRTPQANTVIINNLSLLFSLISEASKELYRQGILR
jgi:hypothetical protein